MKNSKLDVFEEYKIENQVWIYGGEEEVETEPYDEEEEEECWWHFW